MTHSAAAKARDWLLPLAVLWMGFAIAGYLLVCLVPTTFLFLTWIDACHDSAIEPCRLGMFAIPALFLAYSFVIAAHAALPRGPRSDASVTGECFGRRCSVPRVSWWPPARCPSSPPEAGCP